MISALLVAMVAVLVVVAGLLAVVLALLCRILAQWGAVADSKASKRATRSLLLSVTSRAAEGPWTRRFTRPRASWRGGRWLTVNLR